MSQTQAAFHTQAQHKIREYKWSKDSNSNISQTLE